MLSGAAISAAPALARDAPVAPMIETTAKSAFVVDGATGAVLLQKEPDAPFPPASLAKMMMMEIVFAALKDGTLRLDQTFPVSDHAWRTGGAPSGTSTMFAAVRSQVPVDALIRGTIIQSANDGAIILAEGMAGSEAAFAARMNERAAELGMTGSRFVNPTGLPAEGQVVTARDLFRLARHIETQYPDLYRIYAEPSFEWNKIFQRNRNPLLSMDVGADGMETGFTEASGYSIVGVAGPQDRRTFVILSGLPTAKERASEARKLLLWARDGFRFQELFVAGQPVGTAPVFGGAASGVVLTVPETVDAFVPTDKPDRISARIRYDAPLLAPIAKGAKIGDLEIRMDDQTSVRRDLVAGADVETGGFAERALGAMRELAFGWVRAF
ncbi:D-alanyl-D-alanine carboxypeptidase [Aurantimonas sp. Leaf443]|nr:D-alanyl-D-alanine carboxypeptidase [Aurantimonas sp. Leaf443]